MCDMSFDYVGEMLENLVHCIGQLFMSIFGIIYYSTPFVLSAILIFGILVVIKDTKLVRAIIWHIKNRIK